MATIRDLTAAIRQRPGIEAVVILGRDGLLIDSHASVQLDSEDLAARVPRFVAAADEIGESAAKGRMRTTLIEQEHGYAVLSAVGDDAIICVLLSRHADLGSLLHEVRRHRESIARLFQ